MAETVACLFGMVGLGAGLLRLSHITLHLSDVGFCSAARMIATRGVCCAQLSVRMGDSSGPVITALSSCVRLSV